MNDILAALLNAVYECGTIMSKAELLDLAYGEFGFTEYVEDADGNIVDSRRAYNRKSLQDIADIYTDGFDALNY